MTLQDVARELLFCLRTDGNGTLAWEQVREWPEGANAVFEKAGWIKSVTSSTTVECPGCEENCCRTVHVPPAMEGRPVRAYVACDQRADMGRVAIPLHALQRWQITVGQIAHWVSRQLGLKNRPERSDTRSSFRLGGVSGAKRSGILELVTGDPLLLRVSTHTLPLEDLLCFAGDRFTLDLDAIRMLVDLPPVPENERHTPSTTRREARKLETQDTYKGWQKAYLALKRKRPEMSDIWYAQQIAKMDDGKGKNASTIRKHMKK